jgi:predicted RNase H-like HicB family nuclease
MKKHKGLIQLSEIIKEEADGNYSAFCVELGLATCASSFDEAKRRLNKSILLVLNTANEKEEISRLLKEKEIKLYLQRHDSPRAYNFNMTPNEWARSNFYYIII